MTPITSLREEAEPSMIWHELKTDPAVFDAVADGSKTHEIRYDDRNYAIGDGLLLRRTDYTGHGMRHEGAPLRYTEVAPLRFVVTHVLRGYGLEPGWVILSIKPWPSHPEYRSSGEREPLTQEETAFVLNELHSQGHGHGSSLDDFEPECPSCTAADKLKAALADGVKEDERG